MFFLNVRLARPVFTIAKYACSNPVTRSFITSSRVADAKPKTANPTTEKKSKREKPEKVDKPKKSKPEKVVKPKKSKPFSIQDTQSILTRLAVVITEDMKPPQKPHTAYVRFVKEYVGKRPKASSGAETVALIKACAAEWKTLSDAEKAVRFCLTRPNTNVECVDRHMQKAIVKSLRNIVRREQNGLKV
jgi:hypothetical protein